MVLTKVLINGVSGSHSCSLCKCMMLFQLLAVQQLMLAFLQCVLQISAKTLQCEYEMELKGDQSASYQSFIDHCESKHEEQDKQIENRIRKHDETEFEVKRLQMHSVVSPLLMMLDNYHGKITFLDPISGDKYFIKTPQELKGDYQIYCSMYGWLLMSKFEDGPEIVFFNPITSNIHELPAAPCCFVSLCFSEPPTSPHCMVVGFGPCHIYIHFVSHEPPSWRRYCLNFGTNGPYSFHFPTFSGQDIYALCNKKRIDAFRDIGEEDYSLEVVKDRALRSCCKSSTEYFLSAFRDIGEEDYSWEVVKDKALRSCCKSPTEYFLSKCDQHLLLVIVGEFGESVEVFKLNDSTKEWEKLDGLGKYMIYISNTSCICLEAKSPEMGNKIYFPRLLHNEDTKIVFYSLETCKYHTFDDKNIQESFGADLFGTKYTCNPHTWIEPSWS
ncbi:hypothetical protein L1987_00369 [Smallanthus sonchifolius]|uniref:Uncharacterized protein n=1 Tax=Smallanthus sonchifolius TaxID=185202 RepID=A0ACB9K252_9ASTR|nr:hypothetical protein L1987_00369 [Smallanthus sonchifolius]